MLAKHHAHGEQVPLGIKEPSVHHDAMSPLYLSNEPPLPVVFCPALAQSQFGTRHWCTSGTEMLFLGGCCAGLAFEIGKGVDMLLDQNHG